MTATVTPIKHGFSLSSPRFAYIKQRLDDYFERFYDGRRQMPPDIPKKEMLNRILSNDENLARVLHEYGMRWCYARGKDRFCIEIVPPAEIQQYVYYISKYLLQSSPTLKHSYTLQGKFAEAADFLIFKHILHYFRINIPMLFNEIPRRYGGDGGYDFHMGKFRLDPKHHDESVGHGLFVNIKLVDKSRLDDDVIIVHNTNSASFRQGPKLNSEIMSMPIDDALKSLELLNPISMVGWTTFKRFKSELAHGRVAEKKHSYCMDDVVNIKELIRMIVEDQIDEESIFG